MPAQLSLGSANVTLHDGTVREKVQVVARMGSIRLVDGKSREALAGLGTLSEARQFLFASLLLADQLIDRNPEIAAAPELAAPDPALVERAEALANRLEMIAAQLESEAANT